MACDFAPECIDILKAHKRPPENITNNLLNFLTPACINSCRALVERFKKKRDNKLATINDCKRKLSDIQDAAKDERDKNVGKNVKNKTVKGVTKDLGPKATELKKKMKDLQEELKTAGNDLMVELVAVMSKKGGFRPTVETIDGRTVPRLRYFVSLKSVHHRQTCFTFDSF